MLTKQEIVAHIHLLAICTKTDAKELDRAFHAGQSAPASIAKLRHELRDMLALLDDFSAAPAPAPFAQASE